MVCYLFITEKYRVLRLCFLFVRRKNNFKTQAQAFSVNNQPGDNIF